jgi:hypothetical protein
MLASGLAATIGLAGVTSANTAPPATTSHASTGPPRSCAKVSADLRERLEAVVEASLDGTPKLAPRRARVVREFWLVNRHAVSAPADADSLMLRVRFAAAAGDAMRAAQLAVRMSNLSFTWCPGELKLTDHLMRLDLAGQAAWLRAHGLDCPGPAGLEAAEDAVAMALRARNHPELATRLIAAVRGAGDIPIHAGGPLAPANELLQRVDDAEAALR